MRKIFFLSFISSIFLISVIDLAFPHISTAEENRTCVERSGAYRAGIPVEVIGKIPLPKGYKEGLYFDGENIWVNNGKNINTWIVSPSGEMLSEITPPGTFSEGITDSSFSGKYWITDWDAKKLYRVSIENGKMLPEIEISLAPALPTGVTRIGDMLYVLTWTRGLGTKYHLLQLDKNGAILRKMRIRGISEPSQITYDGRYLWITSWYNRRVFQVDPRDFKVMGHFNSPAKETTGIAWDGEFFWITGTYDDLYKIRVEL
jgi:glutamine cyclotransferase